MRIIRKTKTMANKDKGNKTLVKQAKKIKIEKSRKKKAETRPYVTFDSIRDKFEKYIAYGVSERNASHLCGISIATVDKYKNRNPEYKETLRVIKEDVGLQARIKIHDMVTTGDTPVGELNPRDYLNAVTWFAERHKSVKEDFQKTEHKVLEVIKDVPDHIKSKVMDVFEEVEIVEEEDTTYLEDK